MAYWVAIATLISFMRETTPFEKIDLHLIRVLHTVIAERSVSRAAVRLGMHQPAVSTALKRLRDLSGDPILVRSGSGMQPTDAALRMLQPSAEILQAAAIAVKGQLKKSDFDAVVALHPTMAEELVLMR